MNLIFYGYYLADLNIEKRQIDWAPLHIKRWIKGDEIRRSFTVPLAGGGERTYTPQQRSDFMTVMWRSMAHKLQKAVDGPHAIVPIPGHKVLRGHKGSYRTLDYAKTIAEMSGGQFVPADVLRWKTERPPQRDNSGWRSPLPRYNNLELIEPPQLPCIILDDVCTSGSSLAAAEWCLQDAGVDVAIAAVVLRPCHEQKSKTTGWFEETAHSFSRPLI